MELGVKAPYPRQLAQGIGMLLRAWNPDHFIELLAERSGDFPRAGLVIDDLRFLNEYQWLRQHGFLVVYIEGSFRPLQGAEAEHESETALSPEVVPFDLVLPAGSSVAERVEAIVSVLDAVD